MRIFQALALTLLMMSGCPAAEIVAWKVPLSRYASDEAKTAEVMRCKAPPEASPFFKNGDELWDLKGRMPAELSDRLSAMEWVVWNDTSERLVAKGNWADIWTLNELLRPDELPKHYRLMASLHEVAPDGAPTPEDAIPAAALSLVGRSGQSAEAGWRESGKSIELNAGAFISESGGMVDVRLDCNVELPGQPPMAINTAFTLREGETLWVARDFDGQKGLDLKVSASVELIDGTPHHERVMIQKQEQVAPLLLSDFRNLEIQKIGEEGWFVSRWMSARDLVKLLSPDSEPKEVDPFAESPADERTVLPTASSITPPGFLQPWLDHEVLNAKQWVLKIAPQLAGKNPERNFVGYDPFSARLYFFSPDRRLVENFEDYFASYRCGNQPSSVAATLEGNGQTRLVARSAEKAFLKRKIGEGPVIRSLQIEPTIGETGEILDMRVIYSDTKNSQNQWLNTGATLRVGLPLLLSSGAGSGDVIQPLRITGEILRELPSSGAP